MKEDLKRKEARFYTCLVMAFILLIISLFLPPLNVITESVLYAAIALLSTGALVTGVDISGILHELNDLKKLNLENNHSQNNK